MVMRKLIAPDQRDEDANLKERQKAEQCFSEDCLPRQKNPHLANRQRSQQQPKDPDVERLPVILERGDQMQDDDDHRNRAQRLRDTDFAKPVMAQNGRFQVCVCSRGIC